MVALDRKLQNVSFEHIGDYLIENISRVESFISISIHKIPTQCLYSGLIKSNKLYNPIDNLGNTISCPFRQLYASEQQAMVIDVVVSSASHVQTRNIARQFVVVAGDWMVLSIPINSTLLIQNITKIAHKSMSFLISFVSYHKQARTILERHLVIADKAFTMAALRSMANESIVLPTIRDALTIRVREEGKRKYFKSIKFSFIFIEI